MFYNINKGGEIIIMYEILTGLFSLILFLSVFGIIKYGFNIVFFYIALFSFVIVVWGIIAILEERKSKK